MKVEEIVEGAFYKATTVVYGVLFILPTTTKNAAQVAVNVFDHKGKWQARKHVHLRELAQIAQARVKPRRRVKPR